MNGTSGFQEVRSLTSRSPSSRFQHEQWHQFRTGALHPFHTHDLIARSRGISIKRGKVPETLFMPLSKELPEMALQLGLQNRIFLSSHYRTASFLGNVQRGEIPDSFSVAQNTSLDTLTD